MALTQAETLPEAREALHRLLLGAAAASFTDSNGERVEYQAANVARLQAYVATLEAQQGGPKRPHTLRFSTSKEI